MIQILWRGIWQYLAKLKLNLHLDSTTLLLGIYPHDTWVEIQKQLCSKILITLLFVIEKKTANNTNVYQNGNSLKTIIHVQMEYYLAIKMRHLSIHHYVNDSNIIVKQGKKVVPIHLSKKRQWYKYVYIHISRAPGYIAQLFRASSQYANVAGSISGQFTYKKQPMNA